MCLYAVVGQKKRRRRTEKKLVSEKLMYSFIYYYAKRVEKSNAKTATLNSASGRAGKKNDSRIYFMYGKMSTQLFTHSTCAIANVYSGPPPMERPTNKRQPKQMYLLLLGTDERES